jgi:5-methyltetrahydropteroyltriglutamate--homocysteine methyltransferase
MTQRTKPPFRADHVGSLAFGGSGRARQAQNGANHAAELKAIEDREIETVIKKQEQVGLRSVTDGEFRRAFWNYDFLGRLDGVEAYLGERKIKFQGPQPKPMMLRVIGKLGSYSAHPMIEHFKFVAAHTKTTTQKAVPKMTIPSPSSLHFRYGRDAVPQSIYPVMDDFYRDLGASYRKAVRAFADAGCRYLQLDEVFIAMLCDPKYRAQMSARGDDPDKLGPLYGDLINTAMSDIPSDMTITMHLCRGNFRSTFVASGGYEPVAEILFNTIKVHGYFMEYDSARAAASSRCGSCPRARPSCSALSPPRAGNSKAATSWAPDRGGRKCVDIDQLALSPQCGFASTEEGNLLAEERSSGRSCG